MAIDAAIDAGNYQILDRVELKQAKKQGRLS
jgi:hypothetical protein